jgi:hypothetical protein
LAKENPGEFRLRGKNDYNKPSEQEWIMSTMQKTRKVPALENGNRLDQKTFAVIL